MGKSSLKKVRNRQNFTCEISGEKMSFYKPNGFERRKIEKAVSKEYPLKDDDAENTDEYLTLRGLVILNTTMINGLECDGEKVVENLEELLDDYDPDLRDHWLDVTMKMMGFGSDEDLEAQKDAVKKKD